MAFRIDRIPRFPFTDNTLFLALALGALAIDAGGFGLQTFLKLAPCPLCIFQRVIYLTLTALGLIGWLLPFHAIRQFLGYLVLSLGLVGLGTAGYQTWMQAFPEQFTNACNYTEPNLIEQFVDWLGMIEPTLFMASGLCTSKAWTLFGLSMANWSSITFLLITLLSAWRISQPKR